MDNNCGNIDQALLEAYQNTIYRVMSPTVIDIRLGKWNPALNHFLETQNAVTWALITAHNPHSQLLTTAENEARHISLTAEATRVGYRFFPAINFSAASDWPPEVGLFILNIAQEDALCLGRHFDQNAIVFGVIHQLPQLLFCKM